MKQYRSVLLAIGCAVALSPVTAQAESACWQHAELAAYDVTMQTLLMAHIAAACDPVVKADPPLTTQLGSFLKANAAAMQASRDPLNAYYQRAYSTDWQELMNQSLAREDKRISTKVTQNTNPETCADGASLIGALANASWENYMADAVAHGWDQQAGFPACK